LPDIIGHPELLKFRQTAPAAPQGDYYLFLMMVKRKISNFSLHHHQKQVKGEFFSDEKKPG